MARWFLVCPTFRYPATERSDRESQGGWCRRPRLRYLISPTVGSCPWGGMSVRLSILSERLSIHSLDQLARSSTRSGGRIGRHYDRLHPSSINGWMVVS